MQGFVDPMTKKDKILDSEILSEVAVEPPPDMKGVNLIIIFKGINELSVIIIYRAALPPDVSNRGRRRFTCRVRHAI